MSEITLRPATADDQDEVRALIFAVLDEYELEPAPKTTDADLYDLEGFYADGMFEVLETASGEIVGTVGLKPRGNGAVELRKMYLKPSSRGRGLGKRLLKRAIEGARELGANRIELETARVLQEAIGLYEKFGFVPVEREDRERRCDTVLALDLNNKV